MSQKDVPVKTDAGVWEVKARALGLAPRIRTALLLVDGTKSAAELERMMQAAGVAPGALQLLLDKGLIRFPDDKSQRIEESAAAAVKPSSEKSGMQAAGGQVAQPAARPAAAPSAAGKTFADTSVLEVPTLSEIETILGVATELEMQTIIGVAAKLEATPAQAPDTTTRKEKPTQREQAQRAYRAIEEAEKQMVSTSILKMNLVVARAHIANALDQYLGVDGYVLKQRVGDCESRAELEKLFDPVETALLQKMEKPAVARLMGISRALLER